MKHFESASAVFNRDGDFLLFYGKAMASLNRHEEAVEIFRKACAYRSSTQHFTSLGMSYQKLGLYNLAEKSYKTAHFMVPSKFYPEYLLVKLYMESNQCQNAIVLAEKLLQKPIKIESSAIIEIKRSLEELVADKFCTE